jgi:exodeoxyribonuclease-3
MNTNAGDHIITVTLNCRGLLNREKRSTVLRFMEDKRADIIFLQETFVTKQHEHEFNKAWSGQVFHSLTDSCHSRGVCILIKKELAADILGVYRSDDGRRLLVNTSIKGHIMCLVCAYAPNGVSQRI